MILFYVIISTFLNLSNNITIDPPNKTGDIAVFVDNVQTHKGTVYIGLFDSSKTFRKINKVYKVEELNTNKGKGVVVLEDIPYDEYAIVIFQDYNGNKEFDTTFMGVPKEPFGFSTNFKVSTRAPKYKEVVFNHNDEDTELKVVLQVF